MKVSRQQAQENLDRVLDVAGRLFRERGVDNVSVSDVMAAAGLTHGGFYGNFSSKADLVARAAERALVENTDQWEAVIQTATENPFGALVRFYVSPLHRDAPGAGCALSVLATDAARGDAELRAVFTDGVQAYLDLLTRVAPGRTAQLRRKHAVAALASMVGAMVLSRATDDVELSDEVLNDTVTHW